LIGRAEVAQVTLLVEDLRRLAHAASPGIRFPALERVWARGQSERNRAPSPNHLRFRLFGIEPEGALPVAALTHVSDRRAPSANEYYWLRADPVTMWADMARVFMTSHGFADLDPYERNEIELCVREVLVDAGIDLHSDHPERWCIALGQPLEFGFTPLDEALGMDVADALPDHPKARYWRRVLNEIQVALHNCPVNVQRRATGRQEVNSVWFWGGGFIPDAAPRCLWDAVYSENPVSRGLAIINDCPTKPVGEALRAGFADELQKVLIDWSLGEVAAEQELAGLEALVGSLADRCDRGQVTLTLYDGSGEGRSYGARSQRRIWRRRVPLQRALAAETEQ
jgi:hypothetical protein